MKQKETPMVEFNGEAKHAIAMAFEGMGGLRKFINWARTHPMVFYTQIYTKLIPMTLNANATVNVRVTADEERAAIRNAFMRVIDAQKREEARPETPAANVVTGVTYTRTTAAVEPEPPAPPRSTPHLVTPDAAPQSPKGTPATEALTPRAARERAMAPSYPPPISNGEPSTTEKYLNWANAGGWGRRGSDWGPV
jgi:hypothetical protein